MPPFAIKFPRLRALTVLLLVLCLAPVHAAPTPATVVIGGKPVPFLTAPFVGSDGQVYAPADAVHLLGATFAPNADGQSVTVSTPGGKPLSVPCMMVNGRCCIALQKAALALGASADWQPTTQTLTLRARLLMARVDKGTLSLYTSYPVTYRVDTIDGPHRLYVDVYGLDLAALPAAIPVLDPDGRPTDAVRIRSGQMDFNTVRITIDLKRVLPFGVVSAAQTDHIQVALGASAGNGTQVASNPVPPLTAAPPPPVYNPPASALPNVPPSEGVRITNVAVKSGDDGTVQVAVTTTGPAKYRTVTLRDPNRLAFDLAGATLDAGVNPALPGAGPVIKAVRSGILHGEKTPFGRVVVDLARLVGFSVSTQIGDGGSTVYLISLQTPTSPARTGANSLSGKIVVVDPGHGGGDSGALGADGSREKDITLPIGLKLRDVLVQNGATVYMTREQDILPPVMARPAFAITHNADYFVSIHCDASGAQNAHTGTTVYFHAQNALCRRMASDIVNRIADVSGLPANGVKSDTIRFQTGFGVLRGSPMPAVLVECGYMNNDGDLAKLKDDATQQHIAEGIVAGLRDFIADRAAQ